MDERRRYVRFSAQLKIAYTTSSNESWENRKSVECTTLDISAGGIRFNSPQPIEVGVRVLVNLQLSDARRVTFNGQVVSSDHYKLTTTLQGDANYQIGIRITIISPKDRQAVVDFTHSKI